MNASAIKDNFALWVISENSLKLQEPSGVDCNLKEFSNIKSSVNP